MFYLFKILVEPIYVFICNKPLVVHFYLFPKKLSAQHKGIISNHFTFYKRLSPKYQQYFDHRVAQFIENIQFLSRENIEITAEMKLLMASTSTMLTFGMQKYLYTVIKAIIIYPSTFYSTINDEYHIGEFNPKLEVLALSWEDFYKGIKIDDNNLNLGIHEFSHALLFESMKQRKKRNNESYQLFLDEFIKISKDLKKPEYVAKLMNSHYFRDYAFVNSIEFLAVILEHFFETPEQFEIEFPELFSQVSRMINYNEKYFRTASN